MLRFYIDRTNRFMQLNDINEMNLDTSFIASDVQLVDWKGSEGYVKRVGVVVDTRFLDPTPYQPIINQWISRHLSTTVAEAKAIKGSLVDALYDGKRQAPYHFVIAAGDYYWSATDADLANMAVATLPAIIQALFSSEGGTSSLIDQLNANYLTQHNETNTNVTRVNGNEGLLGEAVNDNADAGDAVVDHINDTVLGTSISMISNTINYKLQAHLDTAGFSVASPGLESDIAHNSTVFSHSPALTALSPASLLSVSLAFAVVTSSGSVSWTPIGATAPVAVSIAEMGELMQGILDRRNALLVTRNTKFAELDALTTMAEVLAYDVTEDWPA